MAATSGPRRYLSSGRTSARGAPTTSHLAGGTAERPVSPDRIRKSIGAETTFGADLFTLDEARAALEPLIGKVWSYSEESAIRGRTVTLKARYADFQQVTRSRTGEEPLGTRADIETLVYALL